MENDVSGLTSQKFSFGPLTKIEINFISTLTSGAGNIRTAKKKPFVLNPLNPVDTLLGDRTPSSPQSGYAVRPPFKFPLGGLDRVSNKLDCVLGLGSFFYE